jgi:hypothetical protein
VLSLTAMAAERPRQAVLDLSARPASVDVTAQADGSLLVTTPAGSATVPAPVDLVWEPRTAHAAAGQLLSAVDRMESSTRALSTLCAALDRDVFSFFELFLGAPQRYPCVSAMALFVFGDENVPRPTSTTHRGSALAADPRGDVVVQEASERARDQAAHADVDLIGVGLAGRCLAIRSAGPLPARFEITLRDDRDAPDREVEVAVTDGRVVVLDTTEDDIVPKPLRGAAAHLDPDGLVVTLPVTVSGTVQVVLGVDRSQVRYSDDASV